MSPQTGLALLWLLWVISWWAVAGWSARPTARAPAARQWTYRIILLAGVLLLFGFWRHAPPRLWTQTSSQAWACTGAAALGFGFCWWARLHLGRLWSANVTRKADHRIVDSGPYALVRHPIYTGIILAGFATAAQEGTIPAWAGAAIMTLSWYIKARLEEDFLRAELGAADYDAYAARVPMLIPFLKF